MTEEWPGGKSFDAFPITTLPASPLLPLFPGTRLYFQRASVNGRLAPPGVFHKEVPYTFRLGGHMRDTPSAKELCDWIAIAFDATNEGKLSGL
jgi:hypothetical protein